MHPTANNIKLIILLLGMSGVYAVTHTFQFIHTATTGVTGLPEYVAVGSLDGEPITYYDSKIKTSIPHRHWMKYSIDSDFWKRETQDFIVHEDQMKQNLCHTQKRFNQTGGGMHVYQRISGCKWDDETGETEGYDQYGYDGEDFLVLDLQNMRWIAPVQQAFADKLKWDNDRINLEYRKQYYTKTCIAWMKKLLSLKKGHENFVERMYYTLKRRGTPSVSLFQKSPSSPVTCHVTDFYPREVKVFWRRDGEDVSEDVDLGETLPNHDRTFQKRSTLRVSAEDLDTHNYTCVVQHSSNMHRDIVLTVADIRKTGWTMGLVAGIMVAVVLLALMVGVGLLVWKKSRTSAEPPLDPVKVPLKDIDGGLDLINEGDSPKPPSEDDGPDFSSDADLNT